LNLCLFKGIILSGLKQYVSPTYGEETDPFYYQVWVMITFVFLT
jgi:hypothetical protein